MSITVRQWSREELESLQSNRKLATVFMNGNTFGEEIKYYPYNLRKVYSAHFGDDEVTVFATDDEMVKWFIEQEYTTMPNYLVEIASTYRQVNL